MTLNVTLPAATVDALPVIFISVSLSVTALGSAAGAAAPPVAGAGFVTVAAGAAGVFLSSLNR